MALSSRASAASCLLKVTAAASVTYNISTSLAHTRNLAHTRQIFILAGHIFGMNGYFVNHRFSRSRISPGHIHVDDVTQLDAGMSVAKALRVDFDCCVNHPCSQR